MLLIKPLMYYYIVDGPHKPLSWTNLCWAFLGETCSLSFSCRRIALCWNWPMSSKWSPPCSMCFCETWLSGLTLSSKCEFIVIWTSSCANDEGTVSCDELMQKLWSRHRAITRKEILSNPMLHEILRLRFPHHPKCTLHLNSQLRLVKIKIIHR